MAKLTAGKVGEALAEERLRKTARRLSAIINFVSEGMIAVDETGRIIHCNRVAESILPPPTQLLGQTWNTFFKKEDASRGDGHLHKQESLLERGTARSLIAMSAWTPF